MFVAGLGSLSGSPSNAGKHHQNLTFTFVLQTPDGDEVGTLLTTQEHWQVGEILSEEAPYRVTAVVPLPRIQEFLEGATVGLLEVEPL